MTSATQQIGNYRLLRHLGSGGQATVYLGEHQFLKRLSAVKLLQAFLDEEEGAAFLKEAQLLASLNHPHIIRVQEYTLEGGKPLLVMEYAPGGTLRAAFPAGQPLPLETLLAFLKQIASALQYAHDRGIIHRDLKPENLLLDDQGQIKLSDFGLALFAPSPAQLQTQELVGTVFYMSPEQLRGRPTFATDQYALGVLLYEWLSGQLPFRGTTAEVIGQHLSAEVPSVLQKRPDLPQEVESVLRRALAKEPGQRFHSVLEFARAFEQACHADFPVPATFQAGQSASGVPDFHATLAISQDTAQMAKQRQVQQQIFVPQCQQSQESANRRRMLAKVRTFWIDGVLAQSLRDVAHLIPGLREEPGAVTRPWELVLQQPDEARHPIAPDTSIAEVFDTIGGEFLILGQPGSGKTTLLLELASDLLKRAQTGKLDLLPVVFNLSSWAEKRRSLNEWFIDELSHKYQVPRKLARAWIAQDQILPLLDGLDEVATDAQNSCIEAINAFRRDHGLLPLVICCRTGDYFAQKQRIQLNTAVEIQPLTPRQVEVYLATLGQQFDPVRAALKHDKELRAFFSTPLMLNVLALAYQDQDLSDLFRTDTLDLRQKRLFEAYVRRMLERRGGPAPYTPEQTMHWLSWLAKSMRTHDQSVFYLERLQPSWLPTARLQSLYHRWAVRLPGMVMGGLIGAWIGGLFVLGRLATGGGGFLVLSQTTFESCLLGLFLGFLFTSRHKIQSRLATWGEHLRNGLVLGLCGVLPQVAILLLELLWQPGLIDWSITSSFLGLAWLSFAGVGFLNSLLLKRTPPVSEVASEERGLVRRLWRGFVERSALRNALICALLGLFYGFMSMVGYGDLFGTGPSGENMFGYVFAQMLSFSTSFGIVGLLASIFIQRAGNGEVQPIEKITWSWRSLLGSFLNIKRLGYAVLLGLFYSSLYALLELIFGESSSNLLLTAALSVFGIVALVSWLLSALFGGWSGSQLDERKLITPNQGIRRSALYGLLFGLVSWLIYGAVTWLVRFLASFTPLTQWILPDTWLHSWFAYGLPGALAIGLLIGGWACLKHLMLRRQLRGIDAIPRRYARFLDYAAERILLRKAGGGYLFIHRLLLDYFASLEEQERQKD